MESKRQLIVLHFTLYLLLLFEFIQYLQYKVLQTHNKLFLRYYLFVIIKGKLFQSFIDSYTNGKTKRNERCFLSIRYALFYLLSCFFYLTYYSHSIVEGGFEETS